MRKISASLFLCLISLVVYANDNHDVTTKDTNEVNALNKAGYNARLTKPRETIVYAERALKLARQLKYDKGIAEALRIKGIGQYYTDLPDSALNRYYDALAIYEKLNDERGVAKVYNNIGNLYQMIDYDKALENFSKAEVIAEKYRDTNLIASLSLNIGNIYNRQTRFE